MLHKINKLTLVLPALFAAPVALAHTGEHAGNFLATLVHTLTELNHFTAAIGLGILAAVVHRLSKRVGKPKQLKEPESGI